MSDPTSKTTADELFINQCEEAGGRIMSVLFSYPKPVAVCVVPGVLASVMRVFDIPRETIVAMLDSAVEDIANAE